jgi:hypothetical protein
LAIANTRIGREGTRGVDNPVGELTTVASDVIMASPQPSRRLAVRSMRYRASFQRTDHNDAASRIGAAGREIGCDVPAFICIGQFGSGILALGEQPQGAGFQQAK